VVEVPTLKASLLLTRDKGGQVRGFHNICRHRGNKLVRTGSGTRVNFACEFHGWVFDNTGELKVVPDESQFANLDKGSLGLIPVTAEVWEGLIFVNLDAEPRWTLREWLGEMYDQFGGYWSGMEKLASYQVEVKCNWNLAISAFLEGYHTKYLHRHSAPDYQGGRANPERHRPLIETMLRHGRFSAPRNPDHKVTPAEAAAYKYGRLLTPAFDTVIEDLPPGVNPIRSDMWAFDNLHLFPHVVMLNSRSWHLALWFWPIDHERTLIRSQRLFYKARTAGERFGQAFSKVRAREVLREDLNTLEATQAALESGVMRHIHLSRQEIAVQHHFKVAEDMLAE
jgi:Rieske 2Fe-2S family protein